MRLRKSGTFYLLLFFLYPYISYTQGSFILSTKDTLWDNIPSDGIELQNGDFIITTLKQRSDTLSYIQKVELIKINSLGKIIKSKEFDYLGKNCALVNILQLNPYEFILSGYIIDSNNSYKLWLFKIDSSLNEIENRVYSLGFYNYGNITMKIDHDGNLLFFGCVSDSVYFIPRHIYIGKFSNKLDSIHMKIFSQGFGTFDILEKSDFTGYLGFVTAYSAYSSESIVELDTSFLVLKNDSVPRDIYNFCNVKWIDKTKFLITGEKFFKASSNRYLGTLVLDTSYNVIHENYLGKPDTITFPALMKNLDYLYSNRIFIGGTFNFYPSEFTQVSCWFFINQVDTTLGLHWQKFFGGDANYTLYGILATKDSGCLMYGTRYDWNIQNHERDIYIIKINKDGLLLTADGHISEKVIEVILFPNPATDKIYIRTALKGLLSIFDVNGKLVFSETIQPMSDQFDISFLSQGIYFYQFSSKDKIIDTGKLIKQ